MNPNPPAPPQRVAPVIFPERWDLPGKPEGALPSIQDAFRQTGFQLGADLRLLAEGMNLQLQVIRDSSPSKYRTFPLAAMAMYWSRAFLAINDAALLVARGSYPSCPALARAACEAISAETQAGGEEQPDFLAWLAGSLQPNEEHRATEVGLGSYFAGSTLASSLRLGSVYRVVSEFSRQHFGVTLVEVAPESNRQKLGVTFADQTFHFGWAQLILGWLLALCQTQFELVTSNESPFRPSEETRSSIVDFADRAEISLAEPQRCRVEEFMEGGNRRFLIHNFRRQSGGAPVKLLF
ncbi:MAG: hypothetical protein ACR2PL_14205 [Dehalococcoidia bacterium]